MRAFSRLVLVAAVAAAGCGRSSSSNPSGGPDMGEDGRQIATLVDRLNDDSGRPSHLKQLFAAGATADSRALRQYQYGLKDRPAVTGSTATGTVVLEKAAGSATVEKEWVFVKEGDKWKIKAAPLQ
jgi:hypothetical protein